MEAEKKEQRPNFFLLLGINPNEEWNANKFEQILKQKRSEWSRQSTTSIGQRASQAKKNLELLEKIKAVMNDEALRAQERQQANEEQNTENVKRLQLFETRLTLFNAKDSAEPKEIDAFVKEFQDIIPAKDILNRITIKQKIKTQSRRPTLEPTKARTIAERLQALHMKSLYELLECPEITASNILHQRAKDLCRDVSTNMIKNQENTYKGELAGHATDIFKSEDQRKRYDESLHQMHFQKLLTDLEQLMKHSEDKIVSQGQANIFLDNAQKAGLDRLEALQQLQDYARDHKWLLNAGAQDEQANKITCGNCHTLNPANAKYCEHCKLQLRMPCPECGLNISSMSNACNNCGFPVGNRYLVENQLEDIQQLIRKKDSRKAHELLGETISLWKPKRTDHLIQKIEKARAQILQLEDEQKQLGEQFQQLLIDKKLVAAKQFLNSTDGAAIPNRNQQLTDIQNTIARAQAIFQRAASPKAEREERISLCRQTLLLCSDYQAARDLLHTLPPTEPHNLQAKARGTLISLSWNASATSDVSYVIVRKPFTNPYSSKDGTVLATITGLTYEDSVPEIGIPLYYAVFSVFEQIPSNQGVQMKQPLLLVEEVKLARAEVNDHQVKLSWEQPPYVDSVLVVRKDRMPPSSQTDGTVIAECPAGQTVVVDYNVQNNQTYCYAIFARFKNHEGRLISSPATRLRAIPESPPEPIKTLQIKSNQLLNAKEREVILTWERPTKGHVAILKSHNSLQQYAGKVLLEAQLQNLGQRLEDKPDTITDSRVSTGVTYYTPIVLFNKLAYIGTSQRFATVDDVSNVRWHNLGTALRLQWDWPAHCQEVTISYSLLHWPSEEDMLATHIHVSRAEYDRNGYYDLSGTTNTQYFIVLTAIITHQGEQIAAQGVRITAHLAELMVITYEIRRPGLFRRHPTLYITPQRAGILPKLLLIGMRERLPVHKTDGELVKSIDQISVDPKGLQIELALHSLAEGMYCKLFLEEDSLYQVVDIYHPHEDKLKVN